VIDRSLAFKHIIFALLILWFLLHSVTFFISTPIPILALVPDLALVGVIILASFSIGSYALELMRMDEVSPVEDFLFSTTLGLGVLSLLTFAMAAVGLLHWWSVATGLTLLIIGGFRRIIGLLTPPAYLFGPEEDGDESISLLTLIQFILLSLWIAVLFHFVLLPPVIPESLAMPLGESAQWVINGGLTPDAYVSPQSVSLTTGLYAIPLALRGPHLAMMLSGLIAALTLVSLYSITKRYSGPTTGRSVVLIASSLPIFSYLMLSPGDGMLLALFQLCSFFCMMRWFDEKKRRWALATGFFLGYSLSISITSMFVLVPLFFIALFWAFSQQNVKRFVLHLVIASGAVVVWLLPWIGLHIYVFFDAIHLLNPLTTLNVMSLEQAFISTISLPVELSFPSANIPVFRIVGPIFLIFVPFYFLIQRKNPMTSMATAVGLVTVLIGRPFGVILDYRLIAVLLLSVPTAMATHRFSSNPIKRGATLSMLLLLVFWYFYHSTAVVEDEFNSPHRYILGLDSQDEYLGNAVNYYNDAREINTFVPVNSRLLSLNHEQRLYFDLPVAVAQERAIEEILDDIADGPGIEGALSDLRRDGFTHVLVNHRLIQSEESEMARQVAEALLSRLVYQGETLTLFSLE